MSDSDITIDKPRVSIILPTYKRAHVLPHAIRSVLNQTYTNLELIIVDDNSPDNTAAVVKSFDDARIRYVKNDPNLKLPRALNEGFLLARGTYLTWTSDDNMYADNAIERMVGTLQTGECDFVYTDYYRFANLDSDSRPLELKHVRLPGIVQLERGNHIGGCFLYTRQVLEEIGDYDPELFLVEDYDFFIRVAKRFHMCHIAEPLYYFRRDDDTLYYSRFCEVKASDFLVRYKNGLINEQVLLDGVVALILRNIHGLKNPLLRWSYRAARISFRLARLHKDISTAYLRRKIEGSVLAILEQYQSKNISFGEAKASLRSLMERLGTIEYSRP